MNDVKDTIQEILKQETPIQQKIKPLLEGETFIKLMKKLEKKCRDESVKENYKFCRKKCKFFKSQKCFAKSFEEQRQCCESQGYLKFS